MSAGAVIINYHADSLSATVFIYLFVNNLIFRLFEIILSFRQVLSLICFGLIGPLTKKFDERLVYLLLGLFFSLSTADKET